MERLQAMGITNRLGHVDIEPACCIRDLGVLLDSSLQYASPHRQSDINMFFHLGRLQAQPYT